MADGKVTANSELMTGIVIAFAAMAEMIEKRPGMTRVDLADYLQRIISMVPDSPITGRAAEHRDDRLLLEHLVLALRGMPSPRDFLRVVPGGKADD